MDKSALVEYARANKQNALNAVAIGINKFIEIISAKVLTRIKRMLIKIRAIRMGSSPVIYEVIISEKIAFVQ